MIKKTLLDIQNQTITAQSHIQSYLEVIKKDSNNIFLHVNPNAISDAQKVDEKIKSQKPVGKLAGLGIAIKSNICVDGLIANCASKTLENFTAPYDADVIAKIKAEDGIILGMVNMDEFACGGSGETSAYGVTQNPSAPGVIPGGSSSGSAAAVAAKLCDISLGSDTGGSIRNPASHCGVIGIKPSYGCVSRFGLIDLSMSLDQIGPFCEDLFGCAVMMEVISGRSENDATTKTDDVLKLTDVKSQKYRVGMSSAFEQLCSDKRIYNLIESKVSSYNVQKIELKYIELSVATYYPLVYVEFFSGTRKFDGRKYGLKIEDACGDEVLRRILGGAEISKAEHDGKYYRKALAVKNAIRTQILQAFKEVDVIVLPTTPKLPHKIGDKIDIESMYAYDAFTIPANLAGICAGVIPAGKIDDVPVGLQVYAKNEETLFGFLKDLQEKL